MFTKRSLLTTFVVPLSTLALTALHVDAGPIRIATGPDTGVDGYLDIAPDEYGAWAVIFAGGEGPNDDHFNPLGANGSLQVAFSSGFFIFVPDLLQRELLSTSADWQAVFPADTTLNKVVLTTNVASDTDGDAVDDTLTSAFQVSRTTTKLRFDVTQHVSSVAEGVAVMQQDYLITNESTVAITFLLVRSFDGDLFWDADFGSDEVGTTMHGADLGPFVFEQEPGDPTAAVTLSSLTGRTYFGGKHGVEPEGGLPPYEFGTDTEIWDGYGVPASWMNHIAGVGYDTNGNSGSQPPGSTDPWDGFMGMDFEITLEPAASTSLTVLHTYGQATPFGEPPVEPCDGDVNGDNVVDPLDSGYALARFGCPVGTGDPDCDAADANLDGVVDPLDTGYILSRFGECP